MQSRKPNKLQKTIIISEALITLIIFLTLILN
jgi:hypothetical protein